MSGSSPRRKAVQISPTYSFLSDKLRRISSGSLQCSLFCGGRNCKYENSGRWEEEDKAVGGLYSHWVTEDILAMARPSTHLIRNCDLIGEMKRCGINSVINLQLPLEHVKCGPGIEQSSGFTYCPEEFMNSGVYFYNYGWVDYGVPTLPSLLSMVKVMDFALTEGRVAVHCHAGLGRTGVLIACYLTFSLRLSSEEAITTVRLKRPGSIQTRSQIEVVQNFASFLTPLWTFFPTSSLGLDDLLRNQALVLHGDQQEKLKYIPKVVYDVCQRLLELSSVKDDDGVCDHSSMAISLLAWSEDSGTQHERNVQDRITTIKDEINKSLEWKLIQSETSGFPLFCLLSSFFSSLKEPLLSMDKEEVTYILSLQQLFFPPPSETEAARAAIISKITDTFGFLFSAIHETTPSPSPINSAPENPPATPPVPALFSLSISRSGFRHPLLRTVAAKLAKDIFRNIPSATAGDAADSTYPHQLFIREMINCWSHKLNHNSL